jgi:hypothetical protein
VIQIESIVDPRFERFNEAFLDVGAPRLFPERGLPPDVDESDDEEWRRQHYGLQYGYSHTWFTWAELAEELEDEHPLETAAYKTDPEYLAQLVGTRLERREALATGGWATLVKLVARHVEKHGPTNVRAVIWFTYSSA